MQAVVKKEKDHLNWYNQRMNPMAPYQYKQVVTRVFGGRPPAVLRTMDMGAGLLTNAGYFWEGHTVDLVPIDHVDLRNVSDHYKLKPPVPTLDRIGMTELLVRFPQRSFDFISANNALSWNRDIDEALRSIETALLLIKPEGAVFVNDGSWGGIKFVQKRAGVHGACVHVVQGSKKKCLKTAFAHLGVNTTVLSDYGQKVPGIPSATSCIAFLIQYSR